MSVIGDLHMKEPLLVVGACVDKTIRGLRSKERVIVELLVVVRLLVGRPFRWFVVTAVEESLTKPSSVGEFCPFEVIARISSVLNLANTPLLPVGAGSREAVREKGSVIVDRDPGQSDGPIGRQLVRIEEDPGLSVKRCRPVQDRLVLQPIVAGEEEAIPTPERDAELLIVPQFLQARLNRLSGGDRRKVTRCHIVLRLDPVLRTSRVDLLQPSVRIGDADAVQDVDPILRR